MIEIHTLSEFEGLDEKTESTDEESMIKVMAKSRLPSEDSGIGINDGDNASSGKVLYPTTPNMAFVRLELNGRDGSGIYIGFALACLTLVSCESRPSMKCFFVVLFLGTT